MAGQWMGIISLQSAQRSERIRYSSVRLCALCGSNPALRLLGNREVENLAGRYAWLALSISKIETVLSGCQFGLWNNFENAGAQLFKREFDNVLVVRTSFCSAKTNCRQLNLASIRLFLQSDKKELRRAGWTDDSNSINNRPGAECGRFIKIEIELRTFVIGDGMG